MRKHWIDNLRWVTVLLVLFYHVFYFYNNKGVFGGIGGFGDYPEVPQYQDVVMYVLYPWLAIIVRLLSLVVPLLIILVVEIVIIHTYTLRYFLSHNKCRFT